MIPTNTPASRAGISRCGLSVERIPSDKLFLPGELDVETVMDHFNCGLRLPVIEPEAT
jgi:hypothetical protein